jgi:high-affinity iron transporter
MRRSGISAAAASLVLIALPLRIGIALARGGEVTGRVQMTDLCSPSVSPAVVFLEPAAMGRKSPPVPRPTSAPPRPDRGAADYVIVEQSGLQFVPRVRAMAVGQTIRFMNRDEVPHRVRTAAGGPGFDETVGPGRQRDLTPERSGLVRLDCGIHLHMRGFVIVSPTPWFSVCSTTGDFRIRGIPPGKYMLTAWHEMGDPHRQELTLDREQSLEVPKIVLSSDLTLGTLVRKEIQSRTPVTAPLRPWNEPLDRISVLLAAARDAAESVDAVRATRLFEDAYWGEFEASELESAIRQNLGYARASSLAGRFAEVRHALNRVLERQLSVAALAEMSRKLLLAMVDATRELNEKGIVDNSRIDRPEGNSPRGTDRANQSVNPEDSPATSFQALKRALHRVQFHADRKVPEAAAAELERAIDTGFQPLRRYVMERDPRAAWRQERELNALRGELATGLAGEALYDRFDDFTSRVERDLAGFEERPPGAMGPAFAASLATILAEGCVPILLIAIVLLIHARTPVLAAGAGRADRPAGSRKIGVVMALAASSGIVSALALNAAAHEAAGAILRGMVGWAAILATGPLLLGACRLSSSMRGDATGRNRDARLLSAAALVACCAAAETTMIAGLMLAGQDGRMTGLLGLAAGGLAGLGLLCLIPPTLRALIGRLPNRAFTGVAAWGLAGLALVLSGTGVYALQGLSVLGITPLGWLGAGLPSAGLYPSLEVFVAQVLILLAAGVSWLSGLARRRGEGEGAAETANFLFEQVGGRTAV